MSKLTKKQKLETESRETTIQRQINFSKQYPNYLLITLHRASIQHNMEITVNSAFKFVAWDKNKERFFELPYEVQNIEWSEPLNDLICHLNMLDKEEEEAKRIKCILSGALSKLTAEEKKVLGIKS